MGPRVSTGHGRWALSRRAPGSNSIVQIAYSWNFIIKLTVRVRNKNLEKCKRFKELLILKLFCWNRQDKAVLINWVPWEFQSEEHSKIHERDPMRSGGTTLSVTMTASFKRVYISWAIQILSGSVSITERKEHPRYRPLAGEWSSSCSKRISRTFPR